MDTTKYKVYVDGKDIGSGKHGQKYTEAYLIFGVWTNGAAINENYKIDNVFVYEGDYDLKPSVSVKTAGKTTATWGGVKAR